MAIAEEMEVAGSLPLAPRGGAALGRAGVRATARPPSARQGEAFPAPLQPFYKLASPLQEMEATDVPPPGLHVEALGGWCFEATVGHGAAQSYQPLPRWSLLGRFSEEKSCPMAAGSPARRLT